MNSVKVSVIIPPYNRENLLDFTLKSFEQQTMNKEEHEIIICDDGSDDNLKNKSKNKNGKILLQEFSKYQLFGFDNNIPNNPKKYEEAVKEKLNLQRLERSWHLAHLVETIKDFFYYELFGYNETEFKLSQMIHYKLLITEEALNQLESYYTTMDNSNYNIIDILESMDMKYLKDDVIKFYNNSKYFRKKY